MSNHSLISYASKHAVREGIYDLDFGAGPWNLCDLRVPPPSLDGQQGLYWLSQDAEECSLCQLREALLRQRAYAAGILRFSSRTLQSVLDVGLPEVTPKGETPCSS